MIDVEFYVGDLIIVSANQDEEDTYYVFSTCKKCAFLVRDIVHERVRTRSSKNSEQFFSTDKGVLYLNLAVRELLIIRNQPGRLLGQIRCEYLDENPVLC